MKKKKLSDISQNSLNCQQIKIEQKFSLLCTLFRIFNFEQEIKINLEIFQSWGIKLLTLNQIKFESILIKKVLPDFII